MSMEEQLSKIIVPMIVLGLLVGMIGLMTNAVMGDPIVKKSDRKWRKKPLMYRKSTPIVRSRVCKYCYQPISSKHDRCPHCNAPKLEGN